MNDIKDTLRYKKEDDRYIIFCDDLDTIEGLEFFIDSLIRVLSDFIKTGDEFGFFEFALSINGEIKDEDDSKIWELLASNSEVHESLIKFFNYSSILCKMKGGTIWESDEYQLIENALYKCALTNKRFIVEYSNMLFVWDMSHEVNQYDEVVAIIKQYAWCSEIEDLIVARSTCGGQHDCEFLEEYTSFIIDNNPDFENSEFFKKLVDFFYTNFDSHAEWERDAEYLLPKLMCKPAIERMRTIVNPVQDVEFSDVKVTVHEEGFKYVKLSRKKEGEDNVYETFWTLELKGDSERIVLSEVYNGKLYIVNWDAWLRVYDIETKELVHDRKFGGRISSDAKISKKRNALVLFYSCDKYRCDYINIIDLDDLYNVKSLSIDDLSSSDTLVLGVGEQILFYSSKRNRRSNEWKHAYKLVNEKTGDLECFELENPRRDKYDLKPPFANIEKGIAVYPSWDNLEINIDENGLKTVPFFVRVVDLYSFKEIDKVKLLDFPIFEMCGRYNNQNELEEIIKNKDFDSDEYEDMLKDFYRNLNTVLFDKNTDSIWFCFRGGLIVNMNYKRECSSVVIPASDDDVSKAHYSAYLHAELISFDETGVVIADNINLFKMSFTRDEIYSGKDFIVKPLVPVPSIEFILSKEDEDLISNVGKFLVELDDLTKDECLLEALQTIFFNIRDYNNISAGSNLIIRLKDKNGNYMEEKEFFEKAVKIEGGPQRIYDILDSFIPQDGSDYLYYDCETTALGHAMHALAMHDVWYLPLAQKYINNVDFEHDVFNRETLIPDIISSYPESPIAKELDEYEEEYY